MRLLEISRDVLDSCLLVYLRMFLVVHGLFWIFFVYLRRSLSSARGSCPKKVDGGEIML